MSSVEPEIPENIFRVIVDLLSDGVVIFHSLEQKQVVYTNKYIDQTLGYSPKEIVNKRIPIVAEITFEETTTTTTDETFTGSAILISHKGDKRPFSHSTSAYSYNGHCYYICILQDLNSPKELVWNYLFEENANSIGIVDKINDNFVHVVANKARKKASNETLENLKKTSSERGLSKEDLKEWLELCDAAQRSGISSQPAVHEYVHRLPDGSLRWLKVSFGYVGDFDGHPRFWYTVDDTTPSKLVDEFYMNSPNQMGIIELVDGDSDTQFLLANRAVTTLQNVKDIVGRRSIRDLKYDPAYVKIWIDNFKIAESKGGVHRFEIIAGREKKKYFSAMVSFLGKDHIGNKRFTFFAVDNTQLRLVEMELQNHKDHLEELVKQRSAELVESEERFRSLVSNAPNVIVTVDQHGMIQYANRPLPNISSTNPNITGTIIFQYVEEPQVLRKTIEYVLESKISTKLEVKLQNESLWFSFHIGPTTMENAIIVATDITELRVLSHELEDAMNAKSRFLANMSHEVRTPLSGIIGMARLLGDTPLTKEQMELVDTISAASEILFNVINDVLDFSKIEATGVTLEKQEFDLLLCAEESLLVVLPLAQKKKLELILDFDIECPNKVLGDSMRIKQILCNLLNNAVKFTDSGDVFMGITGRELRTSDHNTNTWEFVFTIQDTGIGVPVESQGKLFQMFSQVDSSTTRKYAGTGVGLAVCKRLVEQMGGSIGMSSTGVQGEGSRFYFSILTEISSPPSGGNLLRYRYSRNGLNVTPRDEFPVIMCGFNEKLCNSLEKKMRRMGFNSTRCFSHGECLNFLGNLHSRKPQNISQVLVFYNVDKIDGNYELLLEISQNARLILVGDMFLAQKTYFLDDVFYLRKPVREKDLCEIIGNFLGEKQAADFAPKNTENHAGSQLANNMGADLNCPIKILIAEDNVMNQKVLERTLRRMSPTAVPSPTQSQSQPQPLWTITVVSDGQAALRATIDTCPDLIFMDVCMPELDGVQCTRKIRQLLNSKFPYIVALTADAFPDDRKKCLDAGMDVFLTKPVKLEGLKEAIMNCVKLKSSIEKSLVN